MEKICSCDNLTVMLRKPLHFDTYNSKEGISYWKCDDCGKWWKLRYQWDAGTGNDSFYIPEGGKKRYVSFTQEEADKIRARVEADS